MSQSSAVGFCLPRKQMPENAGSNIGKGELATRYLAALIKQLAIERSCLRWPSGKWVRSNLIEMKGWMNCLRQLNSALISSSPVSPLFSIGLRTTIWPSVFAIKITHAQLVWCIYATASSVTKGQHLILLVWVPEWTFMFPVGLVYLTLNIVPVHTAVHALLYHAHAECSLNVKTEILGLITWNNNVWSLRANVRFGSVWRLYWDEVGGEVGDSEVGMSVEAGLDCRLEDLLGESWKETKILEKWTKE